MIINSTFTKSVPQADGKFHIIEIHQRDDGPPIIVQYEGEPGDDYQARMLNRVPQLQAELNKEKQDVIDEQNRVSAQAKIDVYINSLPANQLQSIIGLTPDEIAMINPGVIQVIPVPDTP